MACFGAGIGRAATNEARDAERIAREMERRFDGFYLFTNDGSGVITAYQRIEDGIGIDPSDSVVCMPRECFFELAHFSAEDLERTDRGSLVERLRALRDGYRAMRRADQAARAQAVRAWKDAARNLGCLRERGC